MPDLSIIQMFLSLNTIVHVVRFREFNLKLRQVSLRKLVDTGRPRCLRVDAIRIQGIQGKLIWLRFTCTWVLLID